MAQQDGNNHYLFSTMDWEAYVAHRPIYPEALYRMIYDYHTAHSGQFAAALDVGGGIGLVAMELLRRFEHVTLSDPSPLYLEQAQPVFKDVPAPRIAYLQRGSEELVPGDLPRGPVDMITAAEALHWADLDRSMPRFLTALKPGGTLAVWMYGARAALLPADAPGAAAYWQLLEKMATLAMAKLSIDAAAGIMNARFDSMPFDPAFWTDVRRIQVRPDEIMCSERMPFAASRVRAGERVEHHPDGDLLKKEGADAAWIEGYLQNWIPPLNMSVTAAAEFDELRAAMGNTKVTLLWPMVLVLATKK